MRLVWSTQAWTGYNLPSRVITTNFLLTASLKSQLLRFWDKVGPISNFVFVTLKKDYLGRIMTYYAWRYVKRCDLWAWRRKETRNLHASNWLLAQTTHVDITPETSHVGSCPGASYIFQFCMKIDRGFSELWGGVENRRRFSTVCVCLQSNTHYDATLSRVFSWVANFVLCRQRARTNAETSASNTDHWWVNDSAADVAI